MFKILFIFGSVFSISLESMLMSNYSKFLDTYNKSFSENGYEVYKNNAMMIEDFNTKNNSAHRGQDQTLGRRQSFHRRRQHVVEEADA